jgi:hypothetical protein
VSKIYLAAYLYFGAFVAGLNVCRIKSILIWEQVALSVIVGVVYFLLFAETIILSKIFRPTRIQFASLLIVGFFCGVISSMAVYLGVQGSGMARYATLLAIVGVFLGPVASRLLAERFPGGTDKK